MADTKRVNGNLVSWASMKAKLNNGSRYFGFTKVSYSQSRKRVKGVGMNRSQAPRGKTAGKYEAGPLSVTAHKDSAIALRAELAALSPTGKSYGNAQFDFTLEFVEADRTPHLIEFFGVTMEEEKGDNSEGADPTVEDLTFDVLKMKVDGLVLYDDTEDAD